MIATAPHNYLEYQLSTVIHKAAFGDRNRQLENLPIN